MTKPALSSFACFFSVALFAGSALLLGNCAKYSKALEGSGEESNQFPDHLVSFVPYEGNPVFSGTGKDTWDEVIRERGWILKDEDGYHLWYTGYRKEAEHGAKHLGYATSPDGINWERYQDKPIYTEGWVEDMMVVKHEGLYYMFAEGRGDVAHMLTSEDKVNWTDRGDLDIRKTDGSPISPGPYGTPTVYIEDGVWHLFYERDDLGIWLATSKDLKKWTNVQDEPVIRRGPEAYDRHGVALNQVIRYGENYYAYYHGTPTEDWSVWNTNVASGVKTG